MSFLRHAQIYRSDAVAKPGPAVSRCPGHHRLDESAIGYSLAGCSPAEPASASPTIIHAQKSGGWRQPPPDQGWGVFDRRFGEFSSGLDTLLESKSHGSGDAFSLTPFPDAFSYDLCPVTWLQNALPAHLPAHAQSRSGKLSRIILSRVQAHCRDPRRGPRFSESPATTIPHRAPRSASRKGEGKDPRNFKQPSL